MKSELDSREILNLFNRLIRLPFDTSFEGAEFTFSVMMIVCGSVIKTTHSSLMATRSYPIMGLLPHIVGIEDDRGFYSIIFIYLGLWQAISITLTEFAPVAAFDWRRKGWMLCSILWLTVTVMVGYSTPNDIAWVLMSFLFFFSARSYWRLQNKSVYELEYALAVTKRESSALYSVVHFLCKLLRTETLDKVVKESLSVSRENEKESENTGSED